MRRIRAVTLDFFNTVVHHRLGDGGRGRALVKYLTSVGIECPPWEHQILYDVLEPHAREYSPEGSDNEKRAYYAKLARRVFQRMGISLEAHSPADHAMAIWNVIGPNSLELFPDAPRVLAALQEAGYRLAVVSNWQCGLAHFCAELGIRPYLDHVLASAEIGHAKPGAGIFDEAGRLLRCAPDEVLHVGDSVVEDLVGARSAGFHAVLLDRGGSRLQDEDHVIQTLDDLPSLLDERQGMHI